MTTAMPRICTVWIIGGKPGIELNAHRAPAWRKVPSNKSAIPVKKSGIGLPFFIIESENL
jgi:hypothetical protein